MGLEPKRGPNGKMVLYGREMGAWLDFEVCVCARTCLYVYMFCCV